ncbi:hypothetical protein ELI01_18685 [Rhizobium leguminosarum]|uniref:hypothetical protein n=1 Tax=Rhizobium leguminosarum TaxID=384 RepID=UPI00102F4150|nr:hypothetical protein [Rhizobium leguminosarum]TAX57108.1 hypothetical protein ELI01_18685 [Rhizobium leguminosarum]
MQISGYVFLAAAMLVAPAASFAGLHDPEWPPPARFDHAYSGKLSLTKLPQAKLQKACQQLFAKYGLKDTTSFQQHGCAKAFPDSCIVITIDKTYMGATPAAVLRHEVGHCNGWAADHPK